MLKKAMQNKMKNNEQFYVGKFLCRRLMLFDIP